MRVFKSASQRYEDNLDDEMLFGIVAQELSENVISPGLYTKALAETGGDEVKARARYILLRVSTLRLERSARLELEERQFKSSPQQKCVTPTPPPNKEEGELSGVVFLLLAMFGFIWLGRLLTRLDLPPILVGGAFFLALASLFAALTTIGEHIKKVLLRKK